jgi:hypothetical protein
VSGRVQLSLDAFAAPENFWVRAEEHEPIESANDMDVVVSNLDSVVFGIPLVGLLVSAFFRVDELVAAPQRTKLHRRQMPGLDRNGIPMCLDPDGKVTPQTRHAA